MQRIFCDRLVEVSDGGTRLEGKGKNRNEGIPKISILEVDKIIQ